MKKSATYRIEEELLEAAKNAIWHVGQGLTLTDLLEEGLRAQIAALEKKHNKGKPFGHRGGEIAHSPKK